MYEYGNVSVQYYVFGFVRTFFSNMMHCRIIGLCPNFNACLREQLHVKMYHADRLIQFKLYVHTEKIMDNQFSILI